MKVLGIIPSRLESNRLPRKPLFKVFGIPLIVHVVKRAAMSSALDDLIVATDSVDIYDVVKSYGFNAIITSKEHKNGTERIAEVAHNFNEFDYYVLINGDEILLNPNSIKISIDTLLNNKSSEVSILAIKFFKENSFSDFKIVLNSNKELIYISRNDIPSFARNKAEFRLKAYHLMTFTLSALKSYTNLKPTYLEKIEGHEHLRLIENGFKISCSVVDDQCISLDTFDDLPIIENLLLKDKFYDKYKL